MNYENHIPSSEISFNGVPIRPSLDGATVRPRDGMPFAAPPCVCEICLISFRTVEDQVVAVKDYSALLSTAEASAILSRHLSQVQGDREYLRQQIEARGDLLISRWKNKTRQKRADLILRADPDLPIEPFSYFAFLLSGITSKEARENMHRKRFLHPYLTVDQLAKDTTLLFSLLHHRTHSPPEDWAPFDSRIITSSWAAGHFAVDFTIACVYMHGPKYGQLTGFSPEEMHRGDTMGFPRARVVLESQATLLGFLRRIVELLLEGTIENTASSSKWDEMVASGFTKTRSEASWSRFAWQPFSAPPRLQIDDLADQAKARMDAASDHLWLLQTEPTYFQGYIHDIDKFTAARVLPKELLNELYLGEIRNDLYMHQTWALLHDELVYASKLHRRYQDSIHRGKPLPADYDDALGAIELFVVDHLQHQVKHLGPILDQRPGFSKYVTIYLQPDGGLRRKPNLEALPPNTRGRGMAELLKIDSLYWILCNLQGDPDNEIHLDYGLLFAFLDEHLASASRPERDRVDAMLYEKITELHAFVEILATLRLSRPQNTKRLLSDVLARDDRRTWRMFRIKALSAIADPKGSPLLDKLLDRLCKTLPPSGGKGAEWLRDFEAIHSHLQAFWSRMHGDLVEALSPSRLSSDWDRKLLSDMLEVEVGKPPRRAFKLSDEDVRATLAPMEMWNSPGHLRLVQQKKSDVLASLNKPKAPTEFNVFLPLPTGPEQPSKISRADSKIKVKTKGEAAAPPEEGLSPLALGANDETPAPPAMYVTKKTMSVVRAMFPVTAEERTKSVDWDVFRGAMLDVGFSAHSNGGSAVSFEGEQGKIVFHKPHPDPVIHCNMIQWMGKRMNKWFGWSRELFALLK